jgi:hypothetical protein
MKQIRIFLERWGIHSFLLPAFFALHTYNQYYGLISCKVTINAFLLLLLIFLIVFLFLLIFIRDINKSFLVTTILGSIILFYGVIKDFIQLTLQCRFFSKYSVLLPLMLVTAIILIAFVLKRKEHRKLTLFLNLLFLIFIFTDGTKLFISDKSFFLQQNILIRNNQLVPDSLPNPYSKPDVYYLVLDSYPGTHFLKEYMDYDNSPFNNSLKEKGFFVIQNPKSNYNRTAFSIASTLNFEFLRNISSYMPITPKFYNHARLTIDNSTVPKVFKHYNYQFYNLSVFDIGGIPSLRRENFLTLPEKSILFYNTLPERLKSDLLWNLVTGKNAIPFIQKMINKNEQVLATSEKGKMNYNNLIIDSLQKISEQKTTYPKFIYAHVYLPHPPFFYDENGNENEFKYVITEESQKNKLLFLSYLKYTNKIITELAEKIIKANGNHAVIIIQSDHGFRDFKEGPSLPHTFFKNYSAFYFPDKNYSSLYDTMSNINTFPVLFNKYFNTNIPLKRDTSVFLSY